MIVNSFSWNSMSRSTMLIQPESLAPYAEAPVNILRLARAGPVRPERDEVVVPVAGKLFEASAFLWPWMTM